MFDEGLIPLVENNPSLYSWGSQYVLKLRGTKYEMNMIHLAGDCAVPIVGEVVQGQEQIGFIMNREKSLHNCRLPKKCIMEMMRGVVKELHEKGIVHGDIKLPNTCCYARMGGFDCVILLVLF